MFNIFLVNTVEMVLSDIEKNTKIKFRMKINASNKIILIIELRVC